MGYPTGVEKNGRSYAVNGIRTCTLCLTQMPDTTEFFYPLPNGEHRAWCKRCFRERALSQRYSKYGLSAAEYNAMVITQDGRCAICGAVGELSIDHCHTAGNVRGLLCGTCNTGLGMFKDDPKLLHRAIDYLSTN